jgi:hypothetical protein
MVDDKDGHIPSSQIMFTCTVVRQAFLQWHKKQGVYWNAFESKLVADRLDHSNYFNYKNDSTKIASGCAALGPKWLTSPVIAEKCTFLMNS